MARTRMIFSIGPYKYRVSITPGPFYDDGQVISGGTLQESREILISREVPKNDRARVLFRELVRAWEFSTNANIWYEDTARELAAIMAQSAIPELLQQGGLEALMNMRPPRVGRRALCRRPDQSAM
jgi:hypothetical protein